MHRENGSVAGQAVELVGWVVLLGLLLVLTWYLGLIFALAEGEPFLGRSIGSSQATLPGVELAIIPIAASATARLRFGAAWIMSLRVSRVEAMFPLLLAASLLGLLAYVVWTQGSPQTGFGPEPEFGPLRWLGVVLAAGFTWFWTPLFPRVTATLAGMFAGPALFAIVAYLILGPCTSSYDLNSTENYAVLVAIYISSFATIVWVLGAHYLFRLWLGDGIRLDGRPIYFAAWSGVIMLGMALIGTVIFTDCCC